MLKKFLIGTFAVAALAFAMTASAAYDFGTTTLKVGSKGAGVMAVQTVVGATPVDGVFGPMTKAKVMAWQASNGLTADGVFGPMSMAKANAGATVGGSYPAGCTSAVGYSSTTGQPCAGSVSTLPAGCTSTVGYSSTTGAKCDGSTTGSVSTGVLGAGEGDVTNVSEVSSADSKLKEGESADLFAFTADIDGDVSIDRVDIYLNSLDASTQSDNADDYFKSASLSINGTKVSTVDVSDFSEDTYAMDVTGADGDANEYRIRFSGLNSVFKDGDKPKFVLSFDAVAAIDGTDLTQTWGVELEADSIRFVDGKGFSDTAGSVLSETFTPESEDVAKLSVNSSSNDPEITTIEVSSTDETKDVVVFKFNIEEENDVDVTVEDMTVTLTTAGTTDESAVVSSADLYQGSTLLGSESVPSTGIVAFTDMGLEISAGDEEELTLKLTFADVDGYTEGTTVTAVVTSIDEANDANGNDEGDMTITGTGLSSETHILRSTGISVTVKSATTNITVVDGAAASYPDTAEFTWVFDVTAFGDKNVYINADIADIVTSSAVSDVDTLYSTAVSTGASLTGLSGTIVESDSDVSSVTGDAEAYLTVYNGETLFKINKGTTGTFTLTVSGTNATDAKQVRGLLENIEWTTDYVETITATTYDSVAPTINSYTSNLGADAATPYKSIN